MEENISYLTILSYEKEINTYTNELLENNKYDDSYEVSNNTELEQFVEMLSKNAMLKENDITNNLIGLQENNISYFVELDKRFKRKNRIKEKILQKMQVDNMSLMNAANSICDTLRYTIIISDNQYTNKVDNYLKKIEGLGYQVLRFRNTWDGEYYKGINVSFVDYDDFKFEVQFHTPSEYAIKEGKLRTVYNIIRNPNSSSDLVKKANIIRKYYQKQVNIPIGAIDYQYEKMHEKRVK